MKWSPLNARGWHTGLWFACGLALASLLGSSGYSASAGKPPEIPPLTTVSGSPRLPGKFVWADLVTDNVPAAQVFYTRLFGWRFQNFGGYFVGMNDERPLCGMFQRPRPEDKSAQPRWFGYISVKSVSGAHQVVTKAGGKVFAAPKDFPKRGEQAVFGDPEGAMFGVVRSTSGDPEDFKPEPGDWIWIQLLSHDGAKSAEFYRKIGGYEIAENASSNRVSDLVLTSHGFARATIRTIPKSHEKVLPTWLPYVRVESVAATCARAKELGGKVLVEAKPELLEGRVAVVADPTGAAIGLLEWSADLLKGGR